MKKTILLLTALALVPASAFGATMSIGGGGSVDVPEGTIQDFDVVVSLDPEGWSVTGVSYYMYASQSDALDITGRVINPLTTLDTPGTPGSVAGGLDQWNINPLGAIASTGAMAGPEDLATYSIQCDATALTEGTVVTIGLSFANGSDFFLPTVSGSDVPGFPANEVASVAMFTVNITPEPTSALLLLAAVPFMRRRRA